MLHTIRLFDDAGAKKSDWTRQPAPVMKLRATHDHKRRLRSERRGRALRRGGPSKATRRVVANFWQISAKCCSFSAVSAPILQENMRFAAF